MVEFFFLQAEAASSMISPLQREKGTQFYISGVWASWCSSWAREQGQPFVVGNYVSQEGSIQRQVSSVVLCFPAAQRNEYLPHRGRALLVRSGSWKTCSCTLTCSCVLQQDGPACISELLYTTWAYRLAKQVLLLSTEQGGFVRFTFLQVKAFPFIRSCVAAAVGWCTLPTCLPPLILSPAEGNSKRGLNLCTHRAGHHAGRSRGVWSMSSSSSGSLRCQCCRSDRLLQRL